MAHPNNLPQTKQEYLKDLMRGREYKHRLIDAALIYYHSEIPLQEAREYLDTFMRKVR